ncbi:MAG: lipoyl(octanoyl) transferase LipB [Nitriliruptoraceae bacterium]
MTNQSRIMDPAVIRQAANEPLVAVDVGLLAYLDAWQWQKDLVARRHAGEIGDTILLLEHPPVYTLGKRTDRANLLWNEDQRRAHGIDLVEVDRGGDVTYHGPGQLVGYPIIKLASMRAVVPYVRTLEAVLIEALATLGIAAQRSDGYTGVWVGDAKIAAIGVRVASGGITSHGFALNVHPNLADFAGIIPCGIADRDVCSVASLGVAATMYDLRAAITNALGTVLDVPIRCQSVDDLPGYPHTGLPLASSARHDEPMLATDQR